MTWVFFLNSILLGLGLAMDAFSVSLANGLSEPCMRRGKAFGIAGTFAVFQTAMPMLGWVCVHTFVNYFRAFEKFIPWIALVLLCLIGIKMILDGVKHKDDSCEEKPKVGVWALIVQGVATSIDALSVGFTIAGYKALIALVSCLIIGLVTFVLCFAGVQIGRKAGTVIANKAAIFGGVILILIGIEIFVTGLLGV